MTATTVTIEARVHAAARDIWNRSREATLARVDLVERAVTSLLTGTLTEPEREIACREAHRLAGTAGTFGFHRGSELSREIESAFTDPQAMSGDGIRQLAEQVLELRLALEQPSPPVSGATSRHTPPVAPAISVHGLVANGATADAVIDDAVHAGSTTAERIDRTRSTASVLVIDDDDVSLGLVTAQLQAMGYSTGTLAEPMRALDVIERTAPNLVVLDLDMPDVTGIELIRMIRAEPRARHLPIVVLTGQTGSGPLRDAYTAGADDVVRKSDLGDEFRVRVANRLERTRQLRACMAGTEAPVDVMDRHEALRALDRLIRLARRHRRSACIALIDLDHFAALERARGHEAGDAVLRRVSDALRTAWRNDDLVARWGRGSFLVAMFDADGRQGQRRVQNVLETLRDETFQDARGGSFRVTASAGIAQRSRSFPDSRSVLGAAEEALLEAQAGGGDSVVVSGVTLASDDAVVDVALVEDDPALAALLVHALDSVGVRVRCLPDGQQASDQLCGPAPVLRARVVLLDVNLPGLDGLTLLRQLAAADTLRSTRVIVISARASESEMLRAFSLGAFDVVAKPLSVPLLLQRVQRALNA